VDEGYAVGRQSLAATESNPDCCSVLALVPALISQDNPPLFEQAHEFLPFLRVDPDIASRICDRRDNLFRRTVAQHSCQSRLAPRLRPSKVVWKIPSSAPLKMSRYFFCFLKDSFGGFPLRDVLAKDGYAGGFGLVDDRLNAISKVRPSSMAYSVGKDLPTRRADTTGAKERLSRAPGRLPGSFLLRAGCQKSAENNCAGSY